MLLWDSDDGHEDVAYGGSVQSGGERDSTVRARERHVKARRRSESGTKLGEQVGCRQRLLPVPCDLALKFKGTKAAWKIGYFVQRSKRSRLTLLFGFFK